MSKILIESSFFQSASLLSGNETKRIFDFINTFQKDPSNPGISLERLTRSRNNNIWSGRISQDLRAIIYKDGESWILLYAGHHDDSYNWSEKRNIARHNITGAFQITVFVESVEHELKREISETPVKRLFSNHTSNYLLSLGVPENWLPVINEISNEDDLFNVVPRLPDDVAERLISLASGELVTPPDPIPQNIPLSTIPDVIQRFYVHQNEDELKRILDAPLEKWVAFLHPSQNKLVKSTFNGSVKVTGSAGTGKTTVALHRAKFLSNQGKKVLLTSYVGTLCNNINWNLKILCSVDELSRITVSTIHSYALEMIKSSGIKLTPVNSIKIKEFIELYYYPLPLDINSMLIEWESVIQAQGIINWENYRDASRVGRGKALSIKDRKIVWDVFEKVITKLNSKSMMDWSGICKIATDLLKQGKSKSPFDAVIVDEIQDLGQQELKFISALSSKNPENLMLVGDAGQRIYSRQFNLKSLGIDVRGRSHILKINYRTTHQIKTFADKILGEFVDDLDDGKENRFQTQSLLGGPEPFLKGFVTQNEQTKYLVNQIENLIIKGFKASEIAIFARKLTQLESLEKELNFKNIKTNQISDNQNILQVNGINFGTMHRAKGLEFKVVFVIDVSYDNLPLSNILRGVSDNIEKEELEQKEKNLFYVSLTRARDQTFITWVGEPTEFLKFSFIET